MSGTKMILMHKGRLCLFIPSEQTTDIRKFYISRNYLIFQENMVDVDVIITEEERRMLNKSVENEKSGNLVSLEEIKNVRNKTG